MTRNDELRLLWADYEAALWAGLAAVKRQGEISGAELEQLTAAHRKLSRTLKRLGELIVR